LEVLHPPKKILATGLTLTKADQSKINAFELWCWRRMLRIPWTAKRTNASILHETGQKRLPGLINRQALGYFGHVARRQGNCLEKVLLQGKIEGRRRPGRPRTRFIDRIKNLVGHPLSVVYGLAADRHRWHVITEVTSCQT